MDTPTCETWQFTTQPGTADKVYLVVDGPLTPSKWIPMQPVATRPGTWSVVTDIDPGRSRVRYFTEDNGAFLNCGNVGLHGERTSAPSPEVRIDELDQVA